LKTHCLSDDRIGGVGSHWWHMLGLTSAAK